MTKQEISEIKKLFTPKNCSITRICGCYVDGEKNKKTELKQAFLSLPEEEMFKYFEILRKTLSGSPGRNLLTLEFQDTVKDTLSQDENREENAQEFLLRLRESRLKDDALLEEYYDKIIESYEYVGNYLILVIHDVYDVPGKTSDGIQMDDASDEVYEYILSCICPVELSKPGLSYNPLFIYGNSGLGKTHLLYAIAHVIRQKSRDCRILYIKGDEFINDYIETVRSGRAMNEFRVKYREADLMLVDDIQFVAGKVETQNEFFHTFNTLYELKKQIVFTADRPPKEMLRLEDRLKTRFEWGLLADIIPPDYETRTAIIKNKAIRMGMELPDYIIQLIAETITANVRQIEGTVNKIMAYQDINGDKVDKNTVIRAVKDIFKEKSDILPTADVIIEEVCKFYNLEPSLLRGQGRSKDISLARQIAMFQIRRMTNLSLKEIGAEFGGRDHSTVLNALNRIEDLVKTDPEKAEIIKDITTNINSRYE